MSQLFAVILPSTGTVYGPFAERPEAARFADYMTTEVDPAEVRVLCSPVHDLLAWRESVALPRMSALTEGATS